jgi:hypothetical protein
MEKNIFLENYLNQLNDILAIKKGEELSDKEKKDIVSFITSRFKNEDARLYNSYKSTEKKTTLLDAINQIIIKKPIVSGCCTLYKKESEGGRNLSGNFVKYLIDSRKQVKKEMFKAKQNADFELENNLDMKQKVFKVLTNAFYGSLGNVAFALYDENSGPAVTGTGRIIITSLIQTFEAFFADNWNFSSILDIYKFFQDNSERKTKFKFKNEINKDDLFDRLFNKLESTLRTKENKDKLSELIDRLSKTQIHQFYYVNNLFSFLEEEANLNLIASILDYSIPSGNIEDISDEKLLSLLNKLYHNIQENVVNLNSYENRAEFCENSIRGTVLLCDTDSTFINLNKFVEFVKKNFDYDLSIDKNRITACNIAIFMFSNLSPVILEKISDKLNIEEDKRKFLSLKNEFLYKRLLLTPNKKQYAGSLISQEGKLLSPPKLDIKGLDIKKVNTSKFTQNYFQDILDNMIINSEKVEVDKILKKFIELENIIKTSLNNGELTFSIPMKYTNFSNYKFPFRMEVVRGTIVWNSINPDSPIRSMEYVNLLKLLPEDEIQFNRILNKQSKEFIKKYSDIFDKIKKVCFEDEDMKSYGFGRICFPKTLNKTPEWVIPFIDSSTIIDLNINKALILLDSIGIYCFKVKNTEYFSNIIQI